MDLLLLAVAGAALGSFLNVVVVRLPARLPVVRPGSRCPACRAPIPWHEKLPVLSYLWLNGRCRRCGAAIPLQYLLLELLGAAALPALYLVHGWSLALAQVTALAMILTAAALIDRRWGIIPNSLVVAAAALGLAFAVAGGAEVLGARLLAGATTGLLLAAIRAGSVLAFRRPGLGAGDVKLLAALALFLGWETLWVFYLAAAGSAAAGVAGIAAGRMTRASRIPFAPFAALAVVLDLTILPSSILPL